MVWRSLVVLAMFGHGCGGGAASHGPLTAPQVAPSSPAGPDAAAAVDGPDCPQGGAEVRAIGTPCAHEGESCGVKAAAKATRFSNVLTCTGGHWQLVEVPPPPPP